VSHKLKSKIASVIQADSCGHPDVFTRVLHGASRVYGRMIGLRNAGFDRRLLQVRRLPCRVISIGNITVGGTGKSPMTLYTAQLAQQMGYRPAVISRGYGGTAEKAGAVVSDGHRLFADSATAGDEPFMMACRLKGVPVLVGANRFESGMRAVAEFDPDMIILDDAFQHRRLHRDLDLVLVDATRPLGNGYLLPRGPLREPASALLRADAIILTRSKSRGGKIILPGEISGNIPVFCADHTPYVAGKYDGRRQVPPPPAEGSQPAADFAFLRSARVFAFSGIAQNHEFRALLECRIGALAGFAEYPDHYAYTGENLDWLEKKAGALGADCLVTTEKDHVRIHGRLPKRLPLVVVGVGMQFCNDDEAGFRGFFRQKLQEREST
jgi:tetraacyldisaccharide 4'-kinase